MNTVTITKKEYNALVFAKKGFLSAEKNGIGEFVDAGFGIFKRSFGRKDSVLFVNKLRKFWRS